MNELHQIVERIEKAQRVFITTHLKPDGDAVGACLGLSRILRAKQKDVQILELGPIPRRYRGFVAADENADAAEATPSASDLVVVLDCGDLERAPEFVMRWRGGTPIINIDHHQSNAGFGDLNWVAPQASSVGEMIVCLADHANWDISCTAAEALWIAIVTDTGRFAYSNTSPETMRRAARLLECGVATSELDHKLYHSLSMDEMRVQGRALAGLEVYADGRAAVVSLSLQDFDALGVGPEATEDIVNIPRSLAGVQVALFLYEMRDKNGGVATKVSMRTTETYDAAEFCRRWDGGGHRRAAGCTWHVPLSEARQGILDEVQKWLAQS